MSSKNKKPQKQKAEVSFKNTLWHTHANGQIRQLPLSPITLMLQLRRFKGRKLDKILRKQHGLSHSGHLDHVMNQSEIMA